MAKLPATLEIRSSGKSSTRSPPGGLVEQKPKKPLKKVAYTSQFSGKLFNSKESVVKEFSESFTKPITVIESQNQNRFAIEPGFLDFFKKRLQEDHIADFVGQIADDKDIMPYVEKWLEEE